MSAAKRSLPIKLVAGVVKRVAKKLLGDEPVATLVEGATQALGGPAIERLADKLGHADAHLIQQAFVDADAWFAKDCGDAALFQAIRSAPLAGLPSLEKLARDLPKTLDAPAFTEALRWPRIRRR